MTIVLGLCGKVLVVEVVTGVASVRSCWKLPLCPTEPIPAGSKTDPPPAKAISDSGSTSGRTYLRRKKSCWDRQKWQPERRVRTCKRNSPADPQVSAEGGGGGAPGTGAEIPLQPVGKTMVRQAVPLQPREVHGGADLHLQPGEDPTPDQMGSRRRLGPRGKPTLEQVFWQDL